MTISEYRRITLTMEIRFRKANVWLITYEARLVLLAKRRLSTTDCRVISTYSQRFVQIIKSMPRHHLIEQFRPRPADRY